MYYFEQMLNDKWGFDDGESVPETASVARQLYVEVMNKLLAKHDSQLRVVAFDAYTHNPWRILSVTKEFYESLSEKDVVGGRVKVPDWGFDEKLDQPFKDAWNDANDLAVDDFVDYTVTFDRKGFRRFLKSLNK